MDRRKDIKNLVAQMHDDHRHQDILREINTRYDPDFTSLQLSVLKRSMGLKANRYTNGLFNREEYDYFVSIVDGRETKEIAEKINERFGTNYTRQQIRTYMNNHGFKNNVNRQFKQGHTPHNEGMRWEEYMDPDTIAENKKRLQKIAKTGIRSVPPGYISRRGSGYQYVKTEEGTWRRYDYCVWEKHNGPLGENETIVHLDGDKDNVDLDNMAKVDMADLRTLHVHDIHPPYTREILEAYLHLARLIRTAYAAERGKLQ